ncbi:hypothetical protein IWW36_002380 [Coemansia brasiliensis]|uniref:Rab-GAP TBC domain-containing protein n=1 Tax=Coemansia brasiliensis TaxID=2650707 RepID=A0A9W8IG04_9FUNG|nr:hypothetical protein IWW36_002380 [Coemansia brasiliensis]
MGGRNSGDGDHKGGRQAAKSESLSSYCTSQPSLSLQLPALSPTAVLSQQPHRRTSIGPLEEPHLHITTEDRRRKHQSAGIFDSNDPTLDDVALMLARAEVANDLLFRDPKRVVIEHGSLQADKDTLQSLADVQSPTYTEAPSAAMAGPSDAETADRYREYPEGDERALPEFILHSQTMAELDGVTGGWEQELEALPDGEFWRAVLDDAEGLERRAPLHLAAKIRAGIPARVRGAVWQSLTQARSTYLQTVYAQLEQEHSPHERVIRRDLPRTFPKVPVFRQEGGEAQQRLFRILKAYSLYDAEVGYCQGLGFIIGPLIMNMGECEAFCVLVRLMETYDLRGMFTENMAGLHLRLHQFGIMAAEIVPDLMAHLEQLGVLPAMYVPSWFLSLFAYTMPLSFVLRAMDVIMAERAPETIMRIGIALLQRNADKLLAQKDFESAMCVLNSGLYSDDCLRDRPGFVLQEAARLGAVVTAARLDELETSYWREQGVERRSGHQPRAEEPTTHAAVIKFLGWPWSKESTAARQGASPVSSRSDSSDDGGQLSPRVLELTQAQRERSRQLREQILQSLQQQDNAPLTMLGIDSPQSSSTTISSSSSSSDAVEPVRMSTSSYGPGDSAWREQVLEPLQRQLHDARVTSDTHRDALVALQAEHELLRDELVVAKTSRAELAAQNEQLRMDIRKLETERLRAQTAEEALVRARLDLAEADEERAQLERQLTNLRKFVSNSEVTTDVQQQQQGGREDGVVPRARVMSVDDGSPSSAVSPKTNRFSVSAFNWGALRDAITSPRPQPATSIPPQHPAEIDSAPLPVSPRRSSVTVRSSTASSTSDEQSQRISTANNRHSAAIPLAMLHRSKTLPAVPTIPPKQED